MVTQTLSTYAVVLMPMQMSTYCRAWAAAHSAS